MEANAWGVNSMTNDEKWKAISTCDGNYDGVFYYAVITTGIFCRPSCKAKSPLKMNTIYFDHSADALKDGFRPCKLCRPDLAEEAYKPNKDLIEKAKKIFEGCYNAPLNLNETAQTLGISHNHLGRLFKQYFGMTISDYMIELRVKEASRLLTYTDIKITEVALEVGFVSMSHFYKSFKDRTGLAPKEYRIISKNLGDGI